MRRRGCSIDADQPGERSVVASSRCTNAESDLAVLTVPALDDAPAVDAARFGRLVDRDAVLRARATSFPLFKLKNYDGAVVEAEQVKEVFRDSHQAICSIAVLSNRCERTLELAVAPPGRIPTRRSRCGRECPASRCGSETRSSA
jgi:hypothetical protein